MLVIDPSGVPDRITMLRSGTPDFVFEESTTGNTFRGQLTQICRSL